jgi:hypothetical protein
MLSLRCRIAALAILLIAIPAFAQSGRTLPERNFVVTRPESVLGFKIGTDRKLAKWEKFVEYFQKLQETSDRVTVQELGRTTLNRPFIAATITSAENHKRLKELREIQRRLADPRTMQNAAVDAEAVRELIREGRTVVVITCSIHSTEVGGTFSGAEIAYQLASEKSAEIQQILDNVIVLLVPSLNPDGTDIVADWYEKTLNTPAEGTSPPELYHHYTGHDNNRDWYAFTQVETQLTVDKLLNAWHPQIIHDIHQMGASGPRYFVPPYTDPWEPNIDPAITAGVNALGSSMAWELTAQSKSGVITNALFDSWTPARAYAHYHSAFRILSETASARLATPMEIPADKLSAGARMPLWNFPKPWPGGRWAIGDIVNYQSSGAMALLRHAARHRELYLRNFYEIGLRAVQRRDVYAFLLPEPEIPASLKAAAQQFSTDAKSRNTQDERKHAETDEAVKKITGQPSTADEVNYYYKIEGLDRTLGILKRGGVEIQQARKEFTVADRTYPAGTHIILMQQPYGAFAKALLENQRYPDLRLYPDGPPKPPYDVVAHTLPLLMNIKAVAVSEAFKADTLREPAALVLQSRVRSNPGVRVALYQNYLPSMDEGWTRWLFDQYQFPFTRLRHDEARAGNLRAKYDAIILPDQSVNALTGGIPARSSAGEDGAGGAYPAEFTGGLGEAGIRALREFIEAGGTLITFNNASNFAIEKLDAPVKNVLRGISAKEFYCPGSILKTQLDSSSVLTFGIDRESVAWFEASPAFEILDATRARAIVSYSANENPLLSGWILGDQLIRGKAALVEVSLGKGRIVMFGFRPQYRGQSLATVPLLFNAILTSRGE